MTTPRKVCLITPLHPSGNPRLVKEADALSDAGYVVEVIAPDFSSQWRAADEEFRDRAWRIVARPRFGPESPRATRVLELGRRLLAGIATRNLGLMNPAIVRAALHPVAPGLVVAAKDVRADLYIAHLVAALPAAAIAAREHGAIYGFDAEDFHLGDPPASPQYECERRLTRRIESRYLRGCAYVTAASPLIADEYAAQYGVSRPKVVLNVFPRSHAPNKPTKKGTAEPGPSLYWFSQTIGAGRGLECAVDAIAKAQSRPYLHLRGSPAKGYLDTLLSRAQRAGVGERVHILDPALPSELERFGAAYDLGYIGELDETRNRQIALTNKLFSYLLGGVPSVASDIPSHRQIWPEFGDAMTLFLIDDPTSLAAAVDAYLLNPARLATAREHAWRLGQERFNWDVSRSIFLETVDRALRISRRD